MNEQKFYTQYPEMIPYVGESYKLAQKHKCALLIIGESHYLPATSTVHKDAPAWYESDYTVLSDEERRWINTKDILVTELDKDFPKKSHAIFKQGMKKINEHGPQFEDYHLCFKYIVFYNFYLRPANESNTFRELLTQLDNDIANQYFAKIVQKFSPNGIIFSSGLSYDCCSEKNKLSVPIARVPHPSSSWWNRNPAKYGNRYGRDLVQDGLIGINWDPIRYTSD